MRFRPHNVGLTPAEFNAWADEFGYHKWIQEVGDRKLNATTAYVL